MVVPGGVILSLAGVAIVGGREVAWPQVSRVFYEWRAESHALFQGFCHGRRYRCFLSDVCGSEKSCAGGLEQGLFTRKEIRH